MQPGMTRVVEIFDLNLGREADSYLVVRVEAIILKIDIVQVEREALKRAVTSECIFAVANRRVKTSCFQIVVTTKRFHSPSATWLL